MTWQKNYFSSENQPWSRQVEKEVDNLKSNFRSAEVNNTTRDDQLASSFKQLSLTTAQAIEANNNALAAIQDVVDLASPGGPSINASNINAGTIDASVVTVTNLNASNITSGSLSADRITSGTLDASDVNVTNINASNINTGAINASLITTGTLDASDISVINLSASSINTGTLSASRISGGTLDANLMTVNNLSANSITSGTMSADRISGGTIDAITINNTDFNGGTINGTEVYCQLMEAVGEISGPFVNTADIFVNQRITSPGTYSATAAVAANLMIASNGNIARATGTSSREAKQDIAPLEFDKEAFIAISPITFKYKDGIITEGENPQTVGFIAEDFVDAGFSEFLITPTTEYDPYIGLKYEKLYMYLHKVVQEQDKTIKALEARIEALESQV